MHTYIHTSDSFEQENGTGEITEQIPCPRQETVSDAKVPEREALVRSSQTEGLEVDKEGWGYRLVAPVR
jgi:hypothetical protein